MCRKMLAMLTVLMLTCAVASNAYANEPNAAEEVSCSEFLDELDALEAESDAAYEACASARDEAVRNLAAESAVRAGLQVDINRLRKARDAERERRIYLEATRPRRLVWFAAGAGTGAVVVVVVFLLVR